MTSNIGKGVAVSAEQNPQMMLYALGALEQFKILYPLTNVKMAIVQPRLDSISEFEMSVEELEKWGNEVVKPQAEKAFKGEGEFVQGEHCRFCRAKGRCEFRTTENLKKYEEAKNTAIISNTELGQVLSKVEGLDTWIKDLKEEALKQILSGHDVEGWKAVEGKSNRKIVDLDKAFEILEANGIEEALLYERKPLTLTGLEKVVGKAKLGQLIGDHIEKPKGAPTLAKMSDKRENYIGKSAIEDFRKRGKLVMNKFKIEDRLVEKNLKELLKVGCITKSRDGILRILIQLSYKKVLIDESGFNWFNVHDLGTDLKHGCNERFDIIEVYNYSKFISDALQISTKNRELIWKREEDKKEMTVAEIEKALGYSIKIVKESEEN